MARRNDTRDGPALAGMGKQERFLTGGAVSGSATALALDSLARLVAVAGRVHTTGAHPRAYHARVSGHHHRLASLQSSPPTWRLK